MHEEKLNIYDEIIRNAKVLTEKVKKCFTPRERVYVFSIKKMGKIGIWWPTNEAQKLKEKYNTTGFKSYGALMKDYVLIPEELLKNTELMISYFSRSFKYVKSHEPK